MKTIVNTGYRGVAGKVEGLKVLVLQIILGLSNQKTLVKMKMAH